MKVLAVCVADFQRSPLGTRSRLNEPLAGEKVIRRTLRRVLGIRGICSVHVLIEPAQLDAARAAIGDLPVRIETHDGGVVPWYDYVASARKWSLNAWRGGIGGITVFDEWLHPAAMEALARREQAEAVVVFSPAAVLLDPAAAERLIDHYKQVCHDARMALTQTAPGLTPAVFGTALLSDLAAGGVPFGRAIAFCPGAPARDITSQPCFWSVEATIAHAAGRCIVDTDSAWQRVEAILHDLEPDPVDLRSCDAGAVSRWLTEHRWDCGNLPSEVEIELTTASPLPSSNLRPQGDVTHRAEPMTDAVFERVIRELAARDDIRVVLGGFGDPLLHPRWMEYVAACRQQGMFALAVRTYGVELPQPAIDCLLEHRVDVLNILLDAAQPETYCRSHGSDLLEQVHQNIGRLLESVRERQLARPLIVPELLKTAEAMDDIEPFYDYWINQVGTAVIAGPSHYACQWPDRAVMNMAPPTRSACSRLFNRCMVLSDGRITFCDQDFRGLHPVGQIPGQTLSEVWSSEYYRRVRDGHLRGNHAEMGLCQLCDEWHRP